MNRKGLEEVKALAEAVLKNQGLSQDQARISTEVVVTGPRGECHSHGLFRLFSCMSTLAAAKVVADAQPEAYDQTLGIAHVGAKGGFSRPSLKSGLHSLAANVLKQGVAAPGINHCIHFSESWIEIESTTEPGLIGLACIPSHAWVAPSGGAPPLLGPNPLAFDWSRPSDQNPFIYNFATGSVTGGDVKLYLREGKYIPEGWGIGDGGQHSRGSADVLTKCCIAGFREGGRSSALSTKIELIAGHLIGGMTSVESVPPDNDAKASPYHRDLTVAIEPERRIDSSL